MSYKSVLLMLKNVEHWINIPLGENTMKKASEDEYEDYYESDSEFYVVWETGVQPLSDLQRLIFFVITVAVIIVAVVGNALVLYVNFSRYDFIF